MPGIDREGIEYLREQRRKQEAEPVNGFPKTRGKTRESTETLFIKLTSTTQTSSRYPAKIYLRNANDQTWTEKAECWLEGANGESLTTGIYYLARCVGVRAADGLPIFATQRWTSKATWIEFTLPSALAVTDASKASCTVNNYAGGTDPGATVTVYNKSASTNYIFSGSGGDKGIALYDDRADQYKIIQMEC